MISLIEHIEYLTLWHDCVVMPEFGALIAQYVPARFNNDRTIGRPMRTLSFNANVAHNDGLLVQSVARRHGLSYEQALQQVQQQIHALRTQLATTGEIGLGRLGRFERADNGQPVFTPFLNSQACDEFYGLTAVPMPTLTARQRNNTATNTTRQRHFNTRWQAAASVAALLALALLLTTPLVGRHTTTEHQATLELPRVTTTHQSGTIPISWDDMQADLSIALPPNEQSHTTSATNGHYYLVIATFTSDKQVEAYRSAHPDLAPQMQVVQSGRLLRIYIDRSDSYTALQTRAKQLPKYCSDYWISDKL